MSRYILFHYQHLLFSWQWDGNSHTLNICFWNHPAQQVCLESSCSYAFLLKTLSHIILISQISKQQALVIRGNVHPQQANLPKCWSTPLRFYILWINALNKITHPVSVGTYLLHLEPLGTVALWNLSTHLKKKRVKQWRMNVKRVRIYMNVKLSACTAKFSPPHWFGRRPVFSYRGLC